MSQEEVIEFLREFVNKTSDYDANECLFKDTLYEYEFAKMFGSIRVTSRYDPRKVIYIKDSVPLDIEDLLEIIRVPSKQSIYDYRELMDFSEFIDFVEKDVDIDEPLFKNIII
jgi:hypothetical protein